MKVNKVLSVAVILLLLINAALVFFVIKNKPRHGAKRESREPFEMMVKVLEMTEQQQTDYKAHREEHFKNMRPVFDSMRSARTAYFGLIRETNVPDSVIDMHRAQIAGYQAQIDKLLFEHFKKARGLFTPAQQPKFDEFVQKMMQRGRRDSVRKK